MVSILSTDLIKTLWECYWHFSFGAFFSVSNIKKLNVWRKESQAGLFGDSQNPVWPFSRSCCFCSPMGTHRSTPRKCPFVCPHMQTAPSQTIVKSSTAAVWISKKRISKKRKECVFVFGCLCICDIIAKENVFLHISLYMWLNTERCAHSLIVEITTPPF